MYFWNDPDRGGAIGGLITVYGIRQLLFLNYRITNIVSPDQLSDFYSLQTENRCQFPVYRFCVCSITLYGKKYSAPLSMLSDRFCWLLMFFLLLFSTGGSHSLFSSSLKIMQWPDSHYLESCRSRKFCA